MKNSSYADLQSVILDIEYILEDLSVEWDNNPKSKYNSTAFQKAKSSGDNIMCCCPFHSETTPSFGILKEYPYTYNCFGCNSSGNLAHLVAHTLSLPTYIHGEHYIFKNYVILQSESRPPIDIELILDGGKQQDKLVSHNEDELLKYLGKRHNYLYQRGFSERTLQKYEIGYDETSRDIVIPVRTRKGGIRFFKRRSVDSKRFLNESGVFKKDIVYGLHYLAKTSVKEIFLNESETDTMSCYQGKMAAGAILGRILFKEQIIELLKAGIQTVNLFFDNDLAGLRCAYQSFELLSEYPIRINFVTYPGKQFGIDTLNKEAVQFKDANDLLQAKLLNQINVIPFLDLSVKWDSILKEKSDFK